MTPRSRRTFEQYYRVLGWQPFGLLAVIVLAFALVLDNMSLDYAAVAEERDALAHDAQGLEAKLAIKQKVDDKMREAKAQLAVLSEGSYAGVEIGFAEQTLLGYAQGLPVQASAGHIDSATLGPRADLAPLSLISARLAFSGTTSGLVQLLDTARQGIPYLRTAALEIKVDQAERPSKLTADALLQAIYLPEQFTQQAAEAPKKPAK